MTRITVLGGGSWGATLAGHLAQNGHAVAVWEYVKESAAYLAEHRTLKTLPQLRLPATVRVTADMKTALDGAEMILTVVPSHTTKATFEAARPFFPKGAPVVNASKGFDTVTHKLLADVITEACPQAGPVAILSGPSHAEEVAQGKPVALVAAAKDAALAERVKDAFQSEWFRVYTSMDPVGVELGGSLKNIYAVACGVIDGLELGDNTKAALMSRGLMEMTRLGKALGANPLTFFGLSGLGDLIVTCGSQHSRNRLLGEKVGRGLTLKKALAEMTMIAEGVNATKVAFELAKKTNVDAPIIQEMHSVLFEDKSPKGSIRDLMNRAAGAEMEGIAL